jgi:N-acetylglucosamine-6-phosphate deacetylase
VNVLRGRLLVEGALVPGTLRWEKDRIAAVDLDWRATDADRLPIVSPGMIDLHVHGFGGCDPLDDLAGMAKALAAAGTTAFQPTLFPEAPALLGDQARGVWETGQQLRGGARVLGIHLEGPFVSKNAAGALPEECFALPSTDTLGAILGSSTGDGHGVRTMTIAPELPGARDLVRELVRAGVRPSLGHSRATAAEARAAAGDGACGATHLFNAMTPFHHREAGLVGFALSDAALDCEIIGDLTHVAAEAIELALAARGPESLCLVSDALPGAGTGCDHFHWKGREHRVVRGAAWYRLMGDQLLAGSAMGQGEMVRKLVATGVASAAEVLTMATLAPARALGLEHELGVLIPGAHADFVVLSPDLEPIDVIVRGEPVA